MISAMLVPTPLDPCIFWVTWCRPCRFHCPHESYHCALFLKSVMVGQVTEGAQIQVLHCSIISHCFKMFQPVPLWLWVLLFSLLPCETSFLCAVLIHVLVPKHNTVHASTQSIHPVKLLLQSRLDCHYCVCLRMNFMHVYSTINMMFFFS